MKRTPSENGLLHFQMEYSRILSPDPEELKKLSEKFLRIYEFFQNSGNNFRIIQRSFRIRKISNMLGNRLESHAHTTFLCLRLKYTILYWGQAKMYETYSI
jgi:transposase